MPRPDEYQVEGYGVRTEGYDAPYHPAADFDPSVDFAYAGDPEKQAKHQKDGLAKRKRPSEFKSPRETEKRVSDLTASNIPVVDTGTDVREDSDSGVKGTKKAAPSTAKKTESKSEKQAAKQGEKPAAKKTSSSAPAKKAAAKRQMKAS